MATVRWWHGLATLRMSLVAVAGMLVSAMACGAPTNPSTVGVNLNSVRYIRTLAVTQPSAFVQLIYSIPIVGDPLNRKEYSATSLTLVDGNTFEAQAARQFYVPVDTECEFAIEDLAVSSHRVAADIYVNGTLIRRVRAGDNEYGVFKVSRDGRVY
jgi:hypothetical protein